MSLPRRLRWLFGLLVPVLAVGTAIALDSPHTATNLPGVCGECHTTHSAYGALLDPAVGSTIENLCQSCHYDSGPGAAASTHECTAGGNCNHTFTMTCLACHNPHKQEQNRTNSSTYGMFLKATVTTPNSGNRAVNLQGSSGTNSFADDNATNDGICEVCHTQTSHHTNTGSGNDTDHSPAPNCISCHSHENAFRGSGCTAPHDKVQGTRRQIVGTGADFTRPAHHVQGTIPAADSAVCPYM